MELQEMCFAIGRGIVKQMADYALIFLALALAVSLLRSFMGWGADDSDKSKWDRSGLAVRTDHKTGVQYLSDGKGGIILRVDAEGSPVVKR
jgi:hypothetical protein